MHIHHEFVRHGGERWLPGAHVDGYEPRTKMSISVSQLLLARVSKVLSKRAGENYRGKKRKRRPQNERRRKSGYVEKNRSTQKSRLHGHRDLGVWKALWTKANWFTDWNKGLSSRDLLRFRIVLRSDQAKRTDDWADVRERACVDHVECGWHAWTQAHAHLWHWSERPDQKVHARARKTYKKTFGNWLKRR